MDMTIRSEHDRIRIGAHASISFMRTLRIPDDGQDYPLPPGLGTFAIHWVADHADRVPKRWLDEGGCFVPMYQREAMWISFKGAWWRPNALKVGVGGIDALTGAAWDEQLSRGPQNYLVIPDQPWLDGINAGAGFIRQFVAMPLGDGYTVEGQLTGVEREGGLQFLLFGPKPGRFPEEEPPRPRCEDMRCLSVCASEMGLAAGGRMRQEIYADTYGIDTWDTGNVSPLRVRIVDGATFTAITGRPPPHSPVDAATYTNYGLPWFELYDEKRQDIPASAALAGVKSVREIDADGGAAPSPDDESISIVPRQTIGLKNPAPTPGETKW